MDDLISRQAAIDAIWEVDWYHQDKDLKMVRGANSAEHQAWYKAENVYKAINSVPSAERKKGEWVPAKDGIDGHVKCNQCYKTYDYDSEAQYYNFCPNCGADTRKEE